MRERDIFISALQVDDLPRRARLLQEACGGDASLQLRVEQLIAEHERQESFILDRPPAKVSPDETALQPESTRVGMNVGPYKLLQEIGEGGMGVVYLAEQSHPVRRRVAIKIIKPGMDTKQVIARFEAERQALALMDHPNIAKVLDAGTTESGRPYFVMELVKGVPVTKYCDAHRLSPRERLELFLPVCHAVQHAHQKGIIHRDLKPSNVMIALYDGHPVPKVIDFGVAKATGPRLTEKTMFTEFGSVIGTLEYMSPEQAELNQLDVDTRSDVYSLGVLLYELLTGSTPLERKRVMETALQEVLRVIREEDPPKPSTRLSKIEQLANVASARGITPQELTGVVRGELDWIVMKALEKDRTRRYETANGLLRDVERYLADEPVQACPPSPTYRFRKMAQRNKVALLTAGIMAATLVTATAISTWQATVARRAESLASSRLIAEQRALQAARKSEELAEQRLASEQEARRLATAEAAKATAISSLLQDALQTANPDEAKGADYTVRQLLDEVAQELGDRLQTQPEAEAALRATIGNAYRRLGAYDQAEVQLQEALRLRERSLPADHLDLAESRYLAAWNLYELKRVDEAESLVREAIAVHDALGLESSETAAMLVLLQIILVRRDQPQDAVQAGQRILEMARKNPEPAMRAEEASALHNLAWISMRLDDNPQQAEQLGRQALALHREFHGDRHPETAYGLGHLGSALAMQQKWAESEACFRESLEIFSHLYDATHVSVQGAMLNIGAVLLEQGDDLALDEHIDNCNAFMAETMERGPENVTKVLDFLAREGAPYMGPFPDKVLKFSFDAPDRYPEFAQAWNVRALAQLRRDDNAGAVASLTRAIEIDPSVAEFWSYRSLAHLRGGDAASAVADATRGIQAKGNRALAYFYRGEAHRELEQWEQARKDYAQAIAMEPTWSMFWRGRAQVSMAQSRWDDAEDDLAKALTLPALPDERARQVANRATVAARRLLGAVLPSGESGAAGSP